MAREARYQQLEAARHCRRTDQPSRMEMVFRGDWEESLPHCRYLVANRNGRHPDFPAARRNAGEARFGYSALARRDRKGREHEERAGRPRRNWLPDDSKAVAFHAANDLRR